MSPSIISYCLNNHRIGKS
uniref:Uncharacterized protein n=1 Tax=Arundo donax TaxID=35708 RepID=A0A0A9B8B8_ARUDO